MNYENMTQSKFKDSGRFMEDIGIPIGNHKFWFGTIMKVYGRHGNLNPDPKDSKINSFLCPVGKTLRNPTFQLSNNWRLEVCGVKVDLWMF